MIVYGDWFELLHIDQWKGWGHLDLKRATMIVEAFEYSVHMATGLNELDADIKLYKFKIHLNVVDIEASLSFLLGRLRLNIARPYMLHQRVKLCSRGSTSN